MKMNKKLIVPLLATATGLSLAAGFGGAVAWYQFNSQVTASYVGTSVADTHVLQIGYKATDSSPITWGRDFARASSTLVPCTFGQMDSSTKALSLPTTAYVRPEAGKDVDAGYTGWTSAVKNQDYVQFDIYLRDLVADPNAAGVPAEGISKGYRQAAKDIYLRDVVIDCPSETNPITTKSISKAGRIHLAPEGTDANRLISNTEIDAAHKLSLFGNLDLDGDNQPDIKGGYSWTTGRENVILYGRDQEYQTTTGINNIIQQRDGNGKFVDTDVVDTTKKIITTKADAYVKIKVTIWLEGWEKLDIDDQGTTSNIWNPQFSAGTNESPLQVRFGLTFDAGK